MIKYSRNDNHYKILTILLDSNEMSLLFEIDLFNILTNTILPNWLFTCNDLSNVNSFYKYSSHIQGYSGWLIISYIVMLGLRLT